MSHHQTCYTCLFNCSLSVPEMREETLWGQRYITVNLAWSGVGTPWIIAKWKNSDAGRRCFPQTLGSAGSWSPYSVNLFPHRRNVDLQSPRFRRNLQRGKTKSWRHWPFKPPNASRAGKGVVPEQGQKYFLFLVLFSFTAFVLIWTGAEAPSSHLTVSVFYVCSFSNLLLLISLWDTATPPLLVYVTQWA